MKSVFRAIAFLLFCNLHVNVLCSAADGDSRARASRPNVLLMMVDDLGYSDIGCYGSEIETPNIDLLAKKGIRLTQFYNCAKCETTRSTLLSGRYYTEVQNQKLANCVTLAEVMKSADYRTIMTGKWHLKGHPMDRGFERYFGHLSGATNFFTGDDTFYFNREKYKVPSDGFYTTDANVDYAIHLLKESEQADTDSSSKKPFFMYIAFNAPHYPLQAPEKDVKKYIGRYRNGWDQLREERFKKQKAIGLLSKDAQLTLRPEDVPAWDSLPEEKQQHEDLMMATFAAMVDRVDQNIGRLVGYLKETGELENTIVIFLSDNGACPFQRSKKASIEKNLKPWDPKSYWTYDKNWAHAGNTPFREYKQNQHEGGINTPFILSWPGGISSKLNGSIVRQPAHLVDIMPTLVDLAKTTYPETYNGRTVGTARGVSLTPLMNGKELDRSEPLLFSFYGKNNAMRIGDMKLVNKNFGDLEMFDLGQDRTEMKDLSQTDPNQFKRLKKMMFNKFKEVGFSIKNKNRRPGSPKKRAMEKGID